MEGDYREGTTQEAAFEEAFALMETAETGGLDGIWLAERPFAAPGRPLDAFGASIPSYRLCSPHPGQCHCCPYQPGAHRHCRQCLTPLSSRPPGRGSCHGRP